MPGQEDGTITTGDGGVMNGAAEEAASLFAQLADAEGVNPPAESGPNPPVNPDGKAAPVEGGENANATGEPDEGAAADGLKAAENTPEWKAAKAAEDALNNILEEHGFLTPDELKEALKAGAEEDVEQLRKDAEEYRRLKAEQDTAAAEEREAKETPEETIERLRREKVELQQQHEQRQAAERALEEGRKVIEHYDNTAKALVEKMGLSTKAESEMMLQLLGVDNPMDKVDLDDRVAVVKALRARVPEAQNLLKGIKQRAIDEYVAGKSAITPSKKPVNPPGQQPTQTPGQNQPRPGSPDAMRQGKSDVILSPDEEFRRGADELIDALMRTAEGAQPHSG